MGGYIIILWQAAWIQALIRTCAEGLREGWLLSLRTNTWHAFINKGKNGQMCNALHLHSSSQWQSCFQITLGLSTHIYISFLFHTPSVLFAYFKRHLSTRSCTEHRSNTRHKERSSYTHKRALMSPRSCRAAVRVFDRDLFFFKLRSSDKTVGQVFSHPPPSSYLLWRYGT